MARKVHRLSALRYGEDRLYSFTAAIINRVSEADTTGPMSREIPVLYSASPLFVLVLDLNLDRTVVCTVKSLCKQSCSWDSGRFGYAPSPCDRSIVLTTFRVSDSPMFGSKLRLCFDITPLSHTSTWCDLLPFSDVPYTYSHQLEFERPSGRVVSHC